MLVLLAAAAAASAEGIRGFSLGTRLVSGVGLTQSAYYPLKAQAGWEAGLDFSLPLISSLSLGFSSGYQGFLPSNAMAGFTYRGHGGAYISLYAEAGGLLAHSPNGQEVLGGAALGGSAHLDRYSLTELYFFYPGIFIEPFLEHLRRPGRNSFSMSLPLELHFRRDLELSLSVGLGARWRFYP